MQKPMDGDQMTRSRLKKRILVLPGGGATGIATMRVLEALEEKLNRPIAHLFDEIWASSVGSLMAAYLTESTLQGGLATPVRTAKQVSNLIRESFSNPWNAWGCLARLKREVDPQVTLRDTVIPLKILAAEVRDYSEKVGYSFGDFLTETIGLGSDTHSYLSLIEAVSASCAVHPIFPVQRIRAATPGEDVIHCIDAGCGVCTQPTLDPTQHFLAELSRNGFKFENGIQIFFISNGWARLLDKIPAEIEVFNFDLDLSPWFKKIGSGQLQQRIVANCFGAGFASPSILDTLARDSIFGDNWGLFQRMLDELTDRE